MKSHRIAGGLLVVLSTASCGEPPDGDPEPIVTVQGAMASVMGGVEAAIDAPWRLEPIGPVNPARTNVYPPIPITISIHDASLQQDPISQALYPIGQLCAVVIDEGDAGGPLTVITPDSPALREIESSGKWPYTSDHAANHRLCRHWQGESCADVLDVGSTAEWHATIAYTPQQTAPGSDVRLKIQARVAAQGVPCSATAELFPSDSHDRLEWYFGYYVVNGALTVHLGEDRLPRFDGGWVYGDLHYHSQGTDNEGESAYSYRATLQAMRAMGLDFLFATDHACDAAQVTDMDEIYIDKDLLGDYTLVPDALEDAVNDYVRKFELGVKINVDAARDMNAVRFEAMRAWLNQAGTGANAQALQVMAGGGPVVPRIFLGGEVDVVPEISQAERDSRYLRYGNNRSYYWPSACTDVPGPLKFLDEWTTANICESIFDLLEAASEGGRYLVKDIQGLGDQYFARQHVLYLPTDGTRQDAFLSGRTSMFGGATQRLKDILDPSSPNNMIGKGYGFLAHPVDAPSGSGFGRLGPDILPFSDVQLRTAFESPAMLGLQLWNEDTRIHDNAEWLGKTPPAYRKLHDGLYAWDKMLQWGLRPSQTAPLTWLGPGQPRRVFMAGGSDAHGDWNHSREGRLDGTSGINDTAIGKPRNLVYVGTARPETVTDAGGAARGALGQGQVAAALATGQFSITDGPAVRIAIDWNRSGVIDDGDVPMGSVGQVIPGGQLPVIVEWRSTTELQPVVALDLYVGVANDALDATFVYAAAGHGIHGSGNPSGAIDPNAYEEPNNTPHYRLKDGYMADPSGLLRIVPAPADYVQSGNPLWGRRVVNLPVDSFVLGKLRVQPSSEPPVCVPNVWCNHPGYQEQCDYECTEPAPSYHFDSKSRPDRLYVRAFARTQIAGPELCESASDAAIAAQRSGRCTERLGFTNPVWAVVQRPGPLGVRGSLLVNGSALAR
jgi:hypothetical protein